MTATVVGRTHRGDKILAEQWCRIYPPSPIQASIFTEPVKNVVDIEQLAEIRYETRVFELRRLIAVRVSGNENGWTHEFDDLGIIGYGKTRQESIESFEMEFACCWDAIVNEAPQNLTIDAQALAYRTMQLVQTVRNT